MIVENLMVDDNHWRWQEKENAPEKVVKEKGYHELGTNEFVPEDEAYEYAIEACLNGSEDMQKEFKKMLVEWFYSGGDWVKEE
jgi:phenylalanyl-tRNA synthetase beta subunit